MVFWYRRCINTEEANFIALSCSTAHPDSQSPCPRADRTQLLSPPGTGRPLCSGLCPFNKAFPRAKQPLLLQSACSLTHQSPTDSHLENIGTLFHHLKNKPPRGHLKMGMPLESTTAHIGNNQNKQHSLTYQALTIYQEFHKY